MYAIIRRYGSNADLGSKLWDAAEHFGAGLSRIRGFVAAVTVDESGESPFTIALFEDEASLTAGERIAQQLSAAQGEQLGLEAVALSTATVLAQKGL
jgi:hypothetical protein